jgi:hypothetical protein
LRQEAIQLGDVSQLSTRQWIYDVVGYKTFKEKELGKSLSSEKVAMFYGDKMKYAHSSEKISNSFVDVALTVYSRVLMLPDARKSLEWAEENMMGKSPWAKSIYALQALVDRGKTPDRISWALCGLTDLYRMDMISTKEFIGNTLRDPRKSYIEVLNLKSALKKHLLSKWLPSLGLPDGHKEQMQMVFADFRSVRQHVTAYPGGQSAETTWIIGWPESSLAAAEVLEDMVYTCQWDQRFKDAVRSKAKLEDFLEYESVQSALSRVKDMRTKERSVPGTAGDGCTGHRDGVEAAAPAVAASGADELPAEPGMTTEEQNYWELYIDKQLSTYVYLIPDTKSTSDLEQAIRESAMSNIRGDPTGMVVYYWDVKMSGESVTRPELRIPPMRDANYHRMVRTVVSARGPVGVPATLRSGEIAILLDGGRQGNTPKILAPWKEGTVSTEADPEADDEDDTDADHKPGFVHTKLNLIYTEDSIQSRRKRIRGAGTASIQQCEGAHMLSMTRVSLPERKRLHFEGSTSGDTIYGIGKPDMASEWTVTWKDKKEMYTKKYLIPCGGKTEGADPDEEQAERKTDATSVPVTYHSMPEAWYQELIHTFFIKLVVDLTPGDAKFAWQALLNRVGYVGITFSLAHSTAIYDHLKTQMKQEMCKPGSRMFNHQYALATGVKTETGGNTGAGGCIGLPPRRSSGIGRGRGRGKQLAAAGGSMLSPAGGDGPGGGEEASPIAVIQDDEDDVADVWDPLAGDGS